jgi:hypothetical protein
MALLLWYTVGTLRTFLCFMKKKEHYVNNKDFLDALVQYRIHVQEAKDQGKPKPKVPEYVGECFLKIATHLSYRPNFVNYMFKDDMICDGIENCLQYIDNFDPAKSTNPFAYFTQIIYFAFLRRIQREKKQLDIKARILEKSGFDEVFSVDEGSGISMSDLNSIKESLEIKVNR